MSTYSDLTKRFALTAALLALLAPLRADTTAGAPGGQRILVLYAAGFGDNHVTAGNGHFIDTFSGLNGSGLAGMTMTYLQVDAAADGFTDDLTAAGLSLSNFDQVWDTRFNSSAAAPGATANDTITAADAAAFNAYLAGGGSLMLLGENSGFHSRNDSLISYLNTYINTGAAIPMPGKINNNSFPIDVAGSVLAQNFHTDFQALGNLVSTYPGVIPYASTGSGYPVTRALCNASCGPSGSDPPTSPQYPDYNGVDVTMAIAFPSSRIQAPAMRARFLSLLTSTCWQPSARTLPTETMSRT